MRFFTFYSNIMIVLNFWTMTPLVNSALYLSNVLCFMANVGLHLSNPLRLASLTRDVPYLNTIPAVLVHLMNDIWHFTPVYLFRNRQTLSQVISFKSFLTASFFFFFYLATLSEKSIYANYGMNKRQLIFLGLGTLLTFLGAVSIFNGSTIWM